MKTIKEFKSKFGDLIRKEDVLKLIDGYIKAQEGTLAELILKEIRARIEG